jgi:hypothetical protein
VLNRPHHINPTLITNMAGELVGKTHPVLENLRWTTPQGLEQLKHTGHIVFGGLGGAIVGRKNDRRGNLVTRDAQDTRIPTARYGLRHSEKLI